MKGFQLIAIYEDIRGCALHEVNVERAVSSFLILIFVFALGLSVILASACILLRRAAVRHSEAAV